MALMRWSTTVARDR